MDEQAIVKRMAEKVLKTATGYISLHPDYRAIIKKRPLDVTRKIDMVAEEALDDAIIAEGISARVISEELGERLVPRNRRPQYTLVFDPIDGSNNVVNNIPYFCTSIALSKKSSGATFRDISTAAVASMSCGTFSASAGCGAMVDGIRITTSSGSEKPRYAIYSYGAGKVPAGVVSLQEKDCIVRTTGSIALDICMTARNSFDTVIDTRGKVNGYDIMAPGLILIEAGGVITGLSGESIMDLPVSAGRLSIVASADRRLHSRVLEELHGRSQ